MAKHFQGLNNQKGQGFTEYVLLMVITVSLVLALATQVYQPFNKWLKSYMGNYVQCLLDAGELPNLSYTGSQESLCPNEGFSFKDGVPLRTPPPRAPTRISENTTVEKFSGRNSSSSSGSDGSSGRSRSNYSSDSNGNGPRMKNSRGMGVDGGESTGNQTVVENPNPGNGYMKISGIGGMFGNSNRRSVSADGLGGLLEERRKKEKEREPKTFKVAEVDTEGMAGKPRKLRLKSTERKVASIEQDQPWSFAQYLKWAVILMLLLAIILFLVGQAMQISKSMEK